jgi:hypothetical protein
MAQPKKISLLVSLKGLDDKTSWLAVNHQSQSNFDFTYKAADSSAVEC